MSPYFNPYADEQSGATSSSQQPQQPETANAADTTTTRHAAPKKSPKKPKTTETPGWFFTTFNGNTMRWLVATVLCIIVVYLFISLLSTLTGSGDDQVKVLYNSVGQIVSTGTSVDNVGGPVGAAAGQALISGSLGLGTVVVMIYLVMLALHIAKVFKFRLIPLTFKALIITIATSICAGFITFNTADTIRWGGDHGYYVNQFLMSYTSVIGAICVNVALVAIVVIICLSEITRCILYFKRKYDALRAMRQAAKDAEAARQRKVEEEMKRTAIHADGEAAEEPEPEEPAEEQFHAPFEAISDDEADTFDDITTDANEPVTSASATETPAAEAATEEGLEIVANAIEEADIINTDTFDPTAELSRYRFPSIDLLEDRSSNVVTVDTQEQEENKERIIQALAQFNIKISSIKATVGPTITLFEVVPAEGQRIAAIKRVEEDLALALKAMGIRIIAPIPGKGTIGIEVPNSEPQVVSMRSIIASKKFQECKYELPMALGATISNEVFIADLTKMPHLLVAGATGQGKSVGLNAIITSLLYKKHPAELKFVLVDPKMVEFSLYRVLENHYLAKLPDEEDAVITDPNKVVATLNSLCVEMDQRYSLLSQAGCRGVKEYNQKFIAKRLNPERGHRYMPYIVVIVDEFADLIMTAGKEVEAPICRLAQKARAVGIHVIIATQRPSTNVITGLIKANFPGRIAFRVAQMVDSKTILDRSGAHQLVGKGDMFFSTNGNLERVQCAFVDTPEVEAICESIAEQPGYPHAYILPDYVPEAADGGGAAYGGTPGSSYDRDPLFEEAAQFIVQSGTASTSSLQRRYSIGYNRAGKLMDQLEAAGIVGQASGSKPRAVLVDPMTLNQMLGL
jgi:S-DNA-T family DNA segregation ATPase FtsK/SpoIIIE